MEYLVRYYPVDKQLPEQFAGALQARLNEEGLRGWKVKAVSPNSFDGETLGFFVTFER